MKDIPNDQPSIGVLLELNLVNQLEVHVSSEHRAVSLLPSKSVGLAFAIVGRRQCQHPDPTCICIKVNEKGDNRGIGSFRDKHKTTYQIPFALVEGLDSVVQLLYGNRHPALKIGDGAFCTTRSSTRRPGSRKNAWRIKKKKTLSPNCKYL